MKDLILNFNLHELTEKCKLLGEPSFRAKQIFDAVYKENHTQFSQITTLSKPLREKLDAQYTLRSLTKVDAFISKIDGTHKFLWQLADGYKIESVVIYEGKRTTFCISSQVGCALDCKFCETGKMGILRNLTKGEIVEQVLAMQDEIGKKGTNIVFMGMGEPMLNYTNVIQASQILTDERGIGLGKKRITISTSGIIPGIKKFTEEQQPYSLAISLNSIDDPVREKIMPVSKKYPIKDLLNAAKEYSAHSGNLVTFEYVLIDKYNASEADAKKLVHLTHRIPCKINIIPCNSMDPEYKPPSKEKIQAFEKLVNDKSRRITLRKRKGWEIQAACGQLYAENSKKKKVQVEL